MTPGRNTLLETDAHGWLTMRFQVDNMELAQMLVFGLGTQCQVVDPPALQEAERAACNAMIKHLAGP